MEKELNKDKGSIVVEASFVLPIFIIAMFFFINLINIFILHNKIQFAINSAAHEIAAYSYIYDKFGLRAAEQRIKADGEIYTSKIEETVNSIYQAKEDIMKAYNSVQELFGKVKDVFDNANSIVANVEDFTGKIQNLPAETKESVAKLKADAESAKTEFFSAIKEVKGIGECKSIEEALEKANKLKESGEMAEAEIQKIKDEALAYADKVKAIGDSAKEVYASVNKTIASGKEVVNQVGVIKEDVTTAVDSSKTALNNVVERAKGWKDTLKGVGFIAVESIIDFGKNVMGAAIFKKITQNYLGGDGVADAYLRDYGVVNGFEGLDFGQSSFLYDKNKKMIDIMVSYNINLTPFRLILSNPTLKITQRVTIPAWLDGDGQKVDEKFKASKGESGSSSSGTSQPEANLPAIPNNTP